MSGRSSENSWNPKKLRRGQLFCFSGNNLHEQDRKVLKKKIKYRASLLLLLIN